MGLDPNDDSYEPGNACGRCHNVIFDGVTPKYIQAVITGIVKCPLAPTEAPNGTYVLEQQADSCLWIFTNPIKGYICQLQFHAGGTGFGFHEVHGHWFNASPVNQCDDLFVNENVCGPGHIWGVSGTAKVFWGPGIGKDPCS